MTQVKPRPVRRQLSRQKSDAEIRNYRFTHDAPESVERWTNTKPLDTERVVSVLHSYDIPHAPRAIHGHVWCAWCQRRNHFKGGVLEFDSGARRTVGWICAPGHLGVDLRYHRQVFDDERTRRDLLDWFDRVAHVVPDVLLEVQELMCHSSLAAFAACRHGLTQLTGLNTMLLTAILDHEAELRWAERLIDYSRTAIVRESDQEEPADGAPDSRRDRRLRGQRMRVIPRKYRIRGAELVDTRIDPSGILQRTRDTLIEASQFFSRQETDAIEDADFREWAVRLRIVADDLVLLERALAAVSVFFAASHREALIAIRNRKMSEPAYSMTATGIRWHPNDGDAVTVEPPIGYHPPKMRTVARLRRALA